MKPWGCNLLLEIRGGHKKLQVKPLKRHGKGLGGFSF